MRHYLQVWRLRPWVQRLVSRHLKELPSLKQPTVAFHIRGGDMLHTDKHLVRGHVLAVPHFCWGCYQHSIQRTDMPFCVNRSVPQRLLWTLFRSFHSCFQLSG